MKNIDDSLKNIVTTGLKEIRKGKTRFSGAIITPINHDIYSIKIVMTKIKLTIR